MAGAPAAAASLCLPRVGLGTSFYPEDLRPEDPGAAAGPAGAQLPEKGSAAFTAIQNAQTEAAVLFALEHGYRLIDTANGYSNQRAVGSAVGQALGTGLLKREELIIVCKIPARQLTSVETVKEGITQALQRLRVSYIDVLMAHAPPVPAASWQAMEEAVRSGQARSLGVSNFDKSQGREQLVALMSSATIPPAVAQYESHPYQPNDAMAALCEELGLQVMASSPLGAPHKVGAYLSRQRSAGREVDDASKLVLANAAVTAVAQELGCTAGQAVLRWGIQRGHTVIPKSFAPHPHTHLQENFAAWVEQQEHQPLSEAQMASLSSLGRGLRATALYNQPAQQGGGGGGGCTVA